MRNEKQSVVTVPLLLPRSVLILTIICFKLIAKTYTITMKISLPSAVICAALAVGSASAEGNLRGSGRSLSVAGASAPSLGAGSVPLVYAESRILKDSTKSYKEGIINAIKELKDRTGSSSVAIKKQMQANMPEGKKWMNGRFLKALKEGVDEGILIQSKRSFKLSASGRNLRGDPEVRVASVLDSSIFIPFCTYILM